MACVPSRGAQQQYSSEQPPATCTSSVVQAVLSDPPAARQSFSSGHTVKIEVRVLSPGGQVGRGSQDPAADDCKTCSARLPSDWHTAAHRLRAAPVDVLP